MKRKKVYNLFQINLIILIVSSFLLTPIIIVFGYIVDLHSYMDEINIIIVSLIITAVAASSGTVYIVITKEYAERKVKVAYPREFSSLLVISSFGILGIGILFTYLNGPIEYVPNIIIPLFIFTYALLFFVGEKYFNVRLLRK